MSKAQLKDRLTVLVFKDNLASRTFEVPLRWISNFGLLVGAFGILTVLSLLTATKFYLDARRADPTRVNELEQELLALRSTLNQNQTQAPTAPVDLRDTTAPEQNSSSANPPVAANPTEPGFFPISSASTLFSGLPEETQDPPKDPASLSISITNPRAYWEGKTLQVKFNIQYTKQDRGNQQGRIILLARGAETLMGYPTGIFNRTGHESLLDPEQGEYFSVSRFREVHAEFGPVAARDTLLDVEIIILSHDGQLLIHKRLAPETSKE